MRSKNETYTRDTWGGVDMGKKVSADTVQTTISMMRSIASNKPISPFHLHAADIMESLLKEVLLYRMNKAA